ncbi:heat stress transcription factor A-4c-like [Punica granatum]|uniref:HSF-type DNA-binding domain-containing protein n=2 Tax=Punica granatum TaxID=22663 RepID=A0A218WL78_PUNGR|nr:heat stress transcription factor A-4c-like [Punica granatum]OWM72991.1 hypothetical protein CDL15_Pgr001105 [Punica granatum]PKI69041.1 hypothetical protein CRG98_010510 [Punica granatum]
MDDTMTSCGSLPPFLSKTYEMVDDSSTDSIVSWSENNKSFVVWDPPEFARVLLPKYFKHSNFSSFIRQLNTYGFRKSDPEKWEFANDGFIRGQPNLLRNIHRRKPVHSHSGQNVQTQGTVQPLTESERQGLKDDMERLKNEKESLVSEVQKHEKERAELDIQVRGLKDRFHSMEQRHKSMVSNLADVLQKPGLALTLLFESEPNDRKRRLPRLGYLQDEGNGEESSPGTSQISGKENSDGASSGLTSMMDLYDQLESSLTIWENIMSDASQTFDHCFSISNNLELDEAASCAECPAIDMNSEPAVPPASEPPGPAPSKEQKEANPVTTGVNDVFWEQFLTENPGSSETQEVQSERKDKNEGKSSTDGRYWWSVRTVNYLAEQMGHLTPAERT